MLRHRSSETLGAVLLVLLTALMFAGPGAGMGQAENFRTTALADLPLPAQAAVSAALGRDQASYHVQPMGDGYQAENPQHGLAVQWTPSGMEVRTGTNDLCLTFKGYGYGEALVAVGAVLPRAGGNRVEYRRGSLTEWYVNGPMGVEQGFTLKSPPVGERDGPLTLALAVSGEMNPALGPGSGDLTLTAPKGGSLLRYAGLSAYDAAGRELPSWFELKGKAVLLRVDDGGAEYPVVVDPFVQNAKLTASDGAAYDLFGFSVAVSGDTVVVGASKNTRKGAAYVFVKPAGGWADMTIQTAKLTASDGAADDLFGLSVAVSGDAVVVGASGKNTRKGAAYMFVKPAGGWAGNLNEKAKLTASDEADNDQFGFSVAISGDMVVAGALYARIGTEDSQGAAYVFVKPAGGWAGNLEENAKLMASDGAAHDEFGISVAISGDTVVVGAWGKNTHQGAAYVFVKPSGCWAEKAKLTALDGMDYDEFGASVAISGDTVVVGARAAAIGPNSYQGSAYVFVKPYGGWANMTQTAKITATDGASNDYFGSSVAVSGDMVVVGASHAAIPKQSSGVGLCLCEASQRLDKHDPDG